MWLVYLLARATGWGENHIWRMSFARGLMFLHAHLLYQGAATRWAVASADESADIDSKFATLLKRKS